MGKLIVIDGPDGVGKKTQFDILFEKLKQQTTRIEPFDFPQYNDNIFGKLIGECLKGIHGDFVALSPYIACLTYANDRLLAREKILSALSQGFVLCNRYVESNLAFQAAKITDDEKQKQFLQFIDDLEYSAFALPRADLVIYLSMPIEIASKLVEEKEKRNYLDNKGEKDLHEKSKQYQLDVAKTYRKLAPLYPNWRVIECFENGILLPREVIHKKIMKEVGPMLTLT